MPVASDGDASVEADAVDGGAVEGDAEAVLDGGVAEIVGDPVALVRSSVLTPEEPEQPVTTAVTASSAMAATARMRIPCSHV